MTLGDAVKFIMDNRSGDAFKDFTEEQIAETLERTMAEGWLPWAEEEGKLVGIACCFMVSGKLDVDNIIATKPWVVKRFARQANELFPGIEFTANRHGKLHTYDLAKVTQKLNAH